MTQLRRLDRFRATFDALSLMRYRKTAGRAAKPGPLLHVDLQTAARRRTGTDLYEGVPLFGSRWESAINTLASG